MMYDHYVSIHGYGIGPLHLLIAAALIIVPFWQLFSKAGYSGWLSFLMVLPLINLIALYDEPQPNHKQLAHPANASVKVVT